MVVQLAMAAAGACALVLCGCSRIATQSPVRSVGANSWTHHGLLRIGDSRVPDNLNRMLGTLSVDTEIGSLWCARLFVVDDRERLEPELALAVPSMANRGITADGKTITYKLRPGVRWHDGTPFTAADVVFSWQQVVNPNNVVQSQDFYDQVEGIEAPDSLTAIVHLKRPLAGFIAVFFTDYCMLPKHILHGLSSINHADYNRLPVGTGPFQIVENQPGVFIKLIANPHYWRGPPKLKEIDYHFIADPSTLLTQMRTHELDFYRDVPAVQAMELSSVPHTTVYRYAFSRYADIGFNAGRPPLSDIRVRQGLAYATDVPALIRQATHGEYIMADSDQPPWRWTYDATVKQYPHDVRKAKALLDSAGLRVGVDGMRVNNGKPLALSLVGLANDGTALRAEQVLQQQWRAVGVEVTIRNFPEDVLYALGTGVEQSGKFDVSFEGWTEFLDPDNIQLYGCRMAPPNGWNIYHYCNPALDRAEITARGSYDPTARKAAYARIQQAITSDLPFYVLWFVREEDLANSDLRGYRPASTLAPFWNPWEWAI
ncbi:MAG: peptide ABC transporter substrate-binding protein [Candidatus Eremiobacteraeota bacterium]|nr:peptide ABC transporter substrate-binding protein [Candidatus Eremiobacteraeota bacterium]